MNTDGSDFPKDLWSAAVDIAFNIPSRVKDDNRIFAARVIARALMAERERCALIAAAAPDLLAALKMAQLWLDVDGRYDMQAINSAIAKAEGRSNG